MNAKPSFPVVWGCPNGPWTRCDWALRRRGWPRHPNYPAVARGDCRVLPDASRIAVTLPRVLCSPRFQWPGLVLGSLASIDTLSRTLSLAGVDPASAPTPPITPEALLKLADDLRIVIKWDDLGGVAARYTTNDGLFPLPVIVLDYRLHGPRLTCALAEEIGHHLSLVGCTRGWWRTRALWRCRNETRALRIAVDLLIPCDGIGIGDTVDDVAERWGVTMVFAEKAMRLRAASALACSSVGGLRPNVP